MNVQAQSGESIGEDVLCCSEDGKYRYRYSPDKKHRYWLEAKLSDKPGVVMFIMMNPATKYGEVRKSKTTRDKCEAFAEKWGYGRLWSCNLFAFPGKNPAALKDSSFIGPNNDCYIREHARGADKIVCAWGDGKRKVHRDRAADVEGMLIGEGHSYKMYRLGEKLTQKGQPFHPYARGKFSTGVSLVLHCSQLR